MLWVDSTDLKSWAARRDCQGDLPLLIRRLIRATSPDISKILFPAGDNVSSPGWDGILEVSEGNEYIPEGFSIWEMGCNQNVKGKADSDYEKRKENISGINPSETTYVFVSPRAWTKNEKWCEEKRKEGFWKDVKAYNAATLEEWIEEAPAVGIWLGQRLGKYPEGVKALVDWWDEWNMSTTPHLTAELVLAGRDKQVKDIQEELKSSSFKITVQAATIDESIAFLAATINSLPEEEREFYLSRSIIISDSEAFKHISITGKTGLLFIPEFEEIEGLSLAMQKGHTVYIPVGPDNTTASSEIVLPRLGRNEFISALEKMGLSNEDSQKYSRDTGRSLTVLRRQLMDYNNQPEWAKRDAARDIIPALLAGRWMESNDADKKIIELISGETYDSFSNGLYIWRNQPDSPVLKIGELWRLISPMDAFFALAPFITSNDLQKFKDVILKVFKTLDPALELEPSERWMAAVHGKVHPYSNELRKGILQALILIAYFGDDAKISLSTSAQTWVDNIIMELLNDAECNLWISLYDYLPLIAEASPNSFMATVESSLSQDEKTIMCLFEETQGIMGPSSKHSSLLWALELLAWSPDLLSRVTLILGKLTKYDPGGKLGNRPNLSLRGIYLLWHPQTYTSLDKRLEVLDLLIEKYPEVGWNLLTDLMPKNHDVGHPTSKPIWRQFTEKIEVQTPTIAEHYTSVKEIINRLLTHVEYDGQHWVKLLENFHVIPVDERNRIIEQLSSDADNISEGRYELWNKLREIISSHRSYPDADWALPDEEVQDLEKIYLSLEPGDTIDRLCWLFDGWPDLLEGVDIADHDDDDEHFIKLRIDALNEIKCEHGFEGLIKLAERIKDPRYLGSALAEDDIEPPEEEELYSLLEEEEDEFKMVFVKEYIFRKAFNDEEWIQSLVNKARTENWIDLKVVNCFTALPSRMLVWDLLNSFDESIQKTYWKKCRFGGITGASEDKIYYVKQMIQVNRHYTALDIAALYAKEMPPELIAEVLEKTATEKSEDEYNIRHYNIEKLFEELYKSEFSKSEIAKLELRYIHILASVSSRSDPKILHSELANDSEFFAEIIRHIYKRKDGTVDEGEENITQEQLEQRGNLSWKLLHSWKTIPGSDDDGQIDYEKLKSWVDKARELCEESDRIEVCDIEIGGLLAHAEPEDDIWPPEAICKLIEDIESTDLHRGFETGIKNKRGVTARALDEGGKQEIVLANKFRNYAKNINTRFPKTASILISIAEDYENQAKREDEEVDKRNLDY